MASYGEDDFRTINIQAPQKVYDEEDYRTVNIEAPVRVQEDDFKTMNIAAPVRVTPQSSPFPLNPQQYPSPSPHVQVSHNPNYADGSPCNDVVLYVELGLRILSFVFTIIALGLTSSIQQYYIGTIDTFPQYGVAVSVIGVAYSLFQTINSIICVVQQKPMFPRKVSNWVSYVGDQVVAYLLISGGSVMANSFLNCSIGSHCSEGNASAAMLIIGFASVASNVVLSSIKFYKNKW